MAKNARKHGRSSLHEIRRAAKAANLLRLSSKSNGTLAVLATLAKGWEDKNLQEENKNTF